jgi:diguanylate cyclase (GGDEF)-like protein
MIPDGGAEHRGARTSGSGILPAERAEALRARIVHLMGMTDPAAILPTLEARVAAAPEDRVAEERLLLAIAQHRAKQFLPALLSFDAVEFEAERSDDTLLLMHVNLRRGITLGMMGDRYRSSASLVRGAAAAERLGDLRSQATAISNLGYLYGEQDQPVPYREYTERALVVSRELAARFGDNVPLASGLCNLAGALTRLHLFDEARAALEEGDRIAQSIGWEIGRARFLAGHGCLLCEQGFLDEGEVLFERCSEILYAKGEYYQIARHAILRGGFHLAAGRPADALRHYDAALALATEWSFESVQVDLLAARATALERVGDLPAALESLRSLLALRLRAEADRAKEREEADNARAAAMKARWQAEDECRRSRELGNMNQLLRAALAREEALRGEVERLARTDLLTGLANRRFTQELLDRELARVRRSRASLCVAMLDVDNFKAINDTHGHGVGDHVLAEVGRRLVGAVRGADIIGRWGGEEFLVVFVDSDAEAGRAGAERLRLVVAREPVVISPSVSVPVTLSAGVAGRPPDEWVAEGMLTAADRALYEAKARGRNCVVVAAPPPETAPGAGG